MELEPTPDDVFYDMMLGEEELHLGRIDTRLHLWPDHPMLNCIEHMDGEKIWLIFDSDEPIEDMTELGFEGTYHILREEHQYIVEAFMGYQKRILEAGLKEIVDGNTPQ